MTHKRRFIPEQKAGFDRMIRTAQNGRGCRGKVRHPKRKQALTARNQHVAENPYDDRPVEVYRCEDCNGWHIGHGRAV